MTTFCVVQSEELQGIDSPQTKTSEAPVESCYYKGNASLFLPLHHSLFYNAVAVDLVLVHS